MDMKKLINVLFIFAIFALIILYFGEISTFLFPSNEDRAGELVKLVLSVLGGLCVFYGLYINLKRTKATEKSVRIQGEQINLALKSQIDERFKNAIEHLGSEKEPIILGGVAELHQIAKEDSNKYAEVVFSILCSYVRSNTNKKNTNHTFPAVISTIISNLFKRVENNPYKSLIADLSFSNLRGQNIDNCDFKNANLSFCGFHHIENSILDNADLGSSEIHGITFKNNSLRGVKLFHTKIIFTNFKDATLKSLQSNNDNNNLAVRCVHCKFINVSFDDITYSVVFL